jgi:hypothetical protein
MYLRTRFLMIYNYCWLYIYNLMFDTTQKTARRPLNAIEKMVLIIVFTLMIIGVIAAWVNKPWFLGSYVAEDHFIEDVTLIPLAVLSITCFIYLIKFARKKNIWFFLTYFFLGL